MKRDAEDRFATPRLLTPIFCPGIATGGHAYAETAIANPQIGSDTWVWLIKVPMVVSAGTPAYFDPHLPTAAVSQNKEVAKGAVPYLRTVLADAQNSSINSR